jgi:hypothetical protein
MIPVFLFFIGIEVYLRNMPSTYREKKEGLVHNADSIQVLVLGNSHTADGVDPHFFSCYAYNLAFGSQTIYFDRKLLEKYLPILPRLKYVIMSFDYSTLYREQIKERNFFYKYYYDIGFGNQKYIKESFLQSVFVYSTRKTISIVWDNITRRNKSASSTKVFDAAAPVSNYHFAPSPRILNNRISYLNQFIFDGEDKTEILTDLEFMIDTLNQLNIKTILLNTPVYEGLRDLYDKETLEKNKKTADYLIQKYGVTYLDYAADPNYEPNDFLDSDHLNRSGKRKLSLQIDSLIKLSEN